MKNPSLLDRRPIIVALAGPNGAGKSTFYHAHLASAGLRFINTDTLARELGLDPYGAARAADALRRALVSRRESFAFETVFSDPAGEKLAFLKGAVAAGYEVLFCFIGLAGPAISEERVAMRVSQGGHDVPSEKLRSRYPRTLRNLRSAIRKLPHILVYDNSGLTRPFRFVAEFEGGRRVGRSALPPWLGKLLH
ncbi:MAG: AAA family ATPase [Planctomycetes bacterium]|nr:AAA family ATPase [Planctomycetota bacterium]